MTHTEGLQYVGFATVWGTIAESTPLTGEQKANVDKLLKAAAAALPELQKALRASMATTQGEEK